MSGLQSASSTSHFSTLCHSCSGQSQACKMPSIPRCPGRSHSEDPQAALLMSRVLFSGIPLPQYMVMRKVLLLLSLQVTIFGDLSCVVSHWAPAFLCCFHSSWLKSHEEVMRQGNNNVCAMKVWTNSRRESVGVHRF